MVGERGDAMGEISNIPFSMGMEPQTRCSTSTPLIPIFVDTNLDTHLALTISPSETIDDLRAKIKKGHLSCFPHLGDVNVGALMVKRKSFFYHLVDSMLVGSAFHGLKGTRFLLVEISQLDLNIDQGGPRADINNLENNILLKKHHSNGLQAYDKRLPINGSVKAVTKSMSDSMICEKPSLFTGGMDATQACGVGSHNGKLLTGDDYEDCIMEDHSPQPSLNPELAAGTAEKIETINSPPLLLNGIDGETGIPNTSQRWNAQTHSNKLSNQSVTDLSNWRSVKQKKILSVSDVSHVQKDCGQLSKSMQLPDTNKEIKGVAVRNTGISKESKNLGPEEGQHEMPTTISNSGVRKCFDEQSNGKVSDLQVEESPILIIKAKSAEECGEVQKACGQLSNNIQCQTTSTAREENALNNGRPAEECEMLSGRDENIGISTVNKKGEGERLFDGNSNGNASDIASGTVTNKKGKLVDKWSQVKEGCGQLSNDIDSQDLAAARDENVVIKDVLGKESNSSGIGEEILPPNGRKKSKRKRKELCDLNEDSTGCGLSQIQKKSRKMIMEGNNIVQCSSKQPSEKFETIDFLSGQISGLKKVNVSKYTKEDGITALTNPAMTFHGENCNASTDLKDEDIICTQLSTGKMHGTSSMNFDDEFPPNTAGKEIKDLQGKSGDARECVVEKKANSKISIEQDSPRTVGKESKDFQSKADDAQKYDIEKQVKHRKKMSSKHAVSDYEQENSAIDVNVNGKPKIIEDNPLLERKCLMTEETHEVSIALEEDGERKDLMNVPVKYADISTHMDGNQPCNSTGKKKNKRSRNDLLRPERITKEQVPKDDTVIKSVSCEGDEGTPDDGKKKRTDTSGKKHGTSSMNFDDEFPPNTAGKEIKDLQGKSGDARECVIEKKANSKISIEQDSPRTVGKESKDLQSKADDAQKYDIEKQVKHRRKMSSKHAVSDYEQENSAIDVNGKPKIIEDNPLLESKCLITEEAHEVSIALEEDDERKDPMNVPVKYADISTHMDGNQLCNTTGKKKNKRSRNDLLRPERITKEQVPKDDKVIKSVSCEGDEGTPDDGKEKRTDTSGENVGIAYLSTENLKKNAIMDPGHIAKASGMTPIVNKEAYANSDTEMRIRNNDKYDSGKKKVKLPKTSPSKESQDRCVGIDNRLIDEVVAKIGNSCQHSKDEMEKPKDTYVSSSGKKQDNNSGSLKCQVAAENSHHKSTNVAQLVTDDTSYTRKALKERQCIANSTPKIQPGNQKVASERNIDKNSCHKLKQSKNSATPNGLDRIQSSKEKQDDDFETKKPQHKVEDGVWNRNNTADNCQPQKRTTGFVTQNVYKDRQSPGEQHGNNGTGRKLQTPKKTHDGFSVNKIKNKDGFSHEQEKVLEKRKGDKHFTKNLQSLFKSASDESTEEENEFDSSKNSSSESISGNSSDSLDSDGESREKVSKRRSIKSQADMGPSTSGPVLSTATGRKQDTEGGGPIQSRFVHLLAKKTGLGELFKIASAQKKTQAESFSGQFVSTESPSTNMVLETQESQIDPLPTAHDHKEPSTFPVKAFDTNGVGKVVKDKAPKANFASKSCLESIPKASGKSYLLEKPNGNSVHLKATGKITPQMQQSDGWVEPRIRNSNKRTASKH